jgi:hypothetical protein
MAVFQVHEICSLSISIVPEVGNAAVDTTKMVRALASILEDNDVVLPVFCTFMVTVTFWPLVILKGATATVTAMGPIETALETAAFEVAFVATTEPAVPLTIAPDVWATAAVLRPRVQPVKLPAVIPA